MHGVNAIIIAERLGGGLLSGSSTTPLNFRLYLIEHHLNLFFRLVGEVKQFTWIAVQ